MRWTNSGPARCLRLPTGWTAWRSSPRHHPAVPGAPRGVTRARSGTGGRQLDRQRDHLAARLHARSPSPPRSSSGGPDGAILQLSIQCRGGRTDLVITGPALTGRGEDFVVSYVVNNGQPVVVAAGTSASGAGVAIRGDVVRLLASLPDRGEISFRVTPRQGAALDGRYDLAGLKIVRVRLAGPCKWPAVAGAPRN